MDKLSYLRRKKAELFKGDPEKERLFALIRQEEDRLAILKDEWAGRRYKAHREAFNMYTKLDQERRDLDLWIGEEKLKIEVRFQKELETKEEEKTTAMQN